MKTIGELANGAVVPMQQPAEVRAASPARYVFLRMHGAYGAQWLDKWRTGLLDDAGKDRGVASVMAQWDIALAGFSKEVIAAACEHVKDESRRRDAKFPPSMPEFVAECRNLVPRRPPPIAVPDLMQKAEQEAGLGMLATIKQTKLIESSKPNALNRLHDLIVEAVRLAGGSLEDLRFWHMTRQLGE